MKKNKNKELIKNNIRYNSLLILVYTVGIILIVALFKIQILDGLKYREESNDRLIKVSLINQIGRASCRERV